jgi:hypothetical protein
MSLARDNFERPLRYLSRFVLGNLEETIYELARDKVFRGRLNRDMISPAPQDMALRASQEEAEPQHLLK